MLHSITNGKIRIPGSKVPAHLKALRIPPAWDDVMVDDNADAKIYAMGTDAAGRRQRIYNPAHSTKAADQKFARVRKLIACRQEVKEQIELDCRKSDWSEEATVAYLIFETGIRPGTNQETRAKVQAYGATTLQLRHVHPTKSGAVYLKFTGKKGVPLSIKVTNPWLCRELIRRKLSTSAYTSPVFHTTDNLLRQYMDAVTNNQFSPKDLRTMRGTLIAQERAAGRRVPTAQSKRRKLVREIAVEVAKLLGNTPAIALKSYIDPSVVARFA